MRLVQFSHNGSTRLGAEVVEKGDIVDLSAVDPSLPRDTRSFLEAGESALSAAIRAIRSGKGVIKRNEVQIKAPIQNPSKIIGMGLNYVDHCVETNQPIPERPVLFFKLPSSIIGHGEDIVCPDVVEALDYEAELAIIIGKTGRDLKESEAMDCVFGYTAAHDVSARDWQSTKNNNQWSLSKSLDTFCPLGPAIVHKNSLSDPHKLGIRCRLNGKTVQDSNTEKMIFKTSAAVAYISQLLTLNPGDVIVTGTPPGVGFFKNPPEFLKKGDVVDIEIDEIGCISNTIR